MKKLGLGIQELSKFKEKNLIYVDKTRLIYKLTDEGDYYFLSRPGRFGKSLLVSSIQALFSCEKSLFKDCWIYDKWNWEDKYNVIKLSFTEMDYREYGLKKALELRLDELADMYNIEYKHSNYSGKFLELIKKTGHEKPVVILIDEYDKPIIDYLEKSEFEKARDNREILKTFYAGVKEQDKYIRFFFITGVSKFSRVSIFSDLNHLTDITISKHFADIAGYTGNEIEKYYADYLDILAKELQMPKAEVMKDIARWYDGYSWDGKTFVFNPYSIISLFYHQAFRNFWFETGTPTFLINRMKEADKKINESVNKQIDESAFNKYDIDNIDITAIMFQTGYLTIKEVDYKKNKYRIDFPNKEVRDSFLNFAVKHYVNSSPDEMEYIVDMLLEAIEQNDMKSFFTALKSLFSSITVKQLEKVKEYEGFYHSIIYIVLKIIGIEIACEIQSNFGTTDAVIKTDNYIYVLEFRMGSAKSAIDQIEKKKYYAPYLSDKREILIVGFGFDKAKRNLADFLVEKINT